MGPIMPHCDNDFETMALKHSLGVDSEGTVIYAPPPSPPPQLESRRRLEEEEEEEEYKCKCPFMPSYTDEVYASWDQTRKSGGSFLKTLYRFSEVLMGKNLFRP